MGAVHLSHCKRQFVDNRHHRGNFPLLQENQLFAGAQPVSSVVSSFCKSELLYSCAATLNEYHQHDYKQRASNYPDNCGTVHCGFLPLKKSYTRIRSYWNPGVNASFSVPNSPVCAIVEPASGSRFASWGAADSREQSALTYARAAALNQKHQHYDKKHAGDNPDNCGTVHFFPPSP
ncbi:MAG: hypothetical protein WA802_14205 [Terracidiphilus sp.]